LFLLIGAIGIAACTSQKSEIDAKTPAAPAMTPVQRGEYLATVSGCGDCHTPGTLYDAPDFSRKLSGSELGWQGPWGVTYASNLTPDMETGLGGWTDAEIERALRSGVKKDGTPVGPPMPWPDFAQFTPDDMAALIAYLRSLPAVKQANLGPLPPGARATGSIITLPPPSAWDAPKAPPAK
jgi:mono/diheme cytochrome c family protein